MIPLKASDCVFGSDPQLMELVLSERRSPFSGGEALDRSNKWGRGCCREAFRWSEVSGAVADCCSSSPCDTIKGFRSGVCVKWRVGCVTFLQPESVTVLFLFFFLFLSLFLPRPVPAKSKQSQKSSWVHGGFCRIPASTLDRIWVLFVDSRFCVFYCFVLFCFF